MIQVDERIRVDYDKLLKQKKYLNTHTIFIESGCAIISTFA